jgi:diguanylate cyclase (GGDEF)-like protein
MLGAVTRSIGRKLLVAIGLPSLALTLGGVLWLRHEARVVAPGLEPAFRVALIGLLVVSALMATVLVVAVQLLLELPLQRLAAAMRRAQRGDWLHRLEPEGHDELAELARTYNATLAAITDLHAARLEDAASLADLQREVALKEQLEARIGELETLHELAGVLASTLDLDRLLAGVVDLARRRLPGTALAVLLADEATGELVVRAVAGLDAGALGTRLSPAAGAAGRAARERLPIRFGVEEGPLPGAPAPSRAGVAVPLLHLEGVTGVLLLGRDGPEGFPDQGDRLLVSAARQVATAVESARLHQQMVRLSQTDALTGVHNRRHLFARLELERERAARFGERFALLLVDVDRFRELNDAAGHAAGDAALRQVAGLLQRELRSVDLVARSGGEEFAIVLPRAGVTEAAETAERLRAAVAESRVEGVPLGRLTISIGVATFPADARDGATLMDCADAALYAAKRAGRNAVRFHEAGMREAPGRRRGPAETGARG